MSLELLMKSYMFLKNGGAICLPQEKTHKDLSNSREIHGDITRATYCALAVLQQATEEMKWTGVTSLGVNSRIKFETLMMPPEKVRCIVAIDPRENDRSFSGVFQKELQGILQRTYDYVIGPIQTILNFKEPMKKQTTEDCEDSHKTSRQLGKITTTR
jgi:hypothetical protein